MFKSDKKLVESLLAKSIIYRIYSLILTSLILYAITKSIAISISIGLVETTYKIFIYYLFDHFWNKFKFKKIHPCVILLTGLSGSGKSTISLELYKKINSSTNKVVILDGDEIRSFSNNTSFDKESRIRHNLNIGHMASIFEKQGCIVIISLISPYREARLKMRGFCDIFIEVHLSTPIEECIKRDPKGLYKKAKLGEISEFTGITSEYEKPENPEITIDTSKESVENSVNIIYNEIQHVHRKVSVFS